MPSEKEARKLTGKIRPEFNQSETVFSAETLCFWSISGEYQNRPCLGIWHRREKSAATVCCDSFGRHVDLGSRITDAGLKNFGSKIWDNLQIVDISGCFNISDDGMQIFSKCVPSMTKLDLSHCSRVADPSLMHVLTNCTSLKELSIQETSVTLTSSSLDYFQTNPTHLTLLVARGCSGATDSGFATLVQCSPNLELLDISQCTQLGNQTVISAVTNCKIGSVGGQKCSLV